MAFTTVRSASGVDFIGTPGVDVGVFFDEIGNVLATGLGGNDVITVQNSNNIQRTTTLEGGTGDDRINVGPSLSDSSINGNDGRDTIVFFGNTVSNSFIGGGAGADDLDLRFTQILATLVTGGSGADLINLLDSDLALSTINGGDGNDTIILQTAAGAARQILNTSSINGNGGNDVITARFLNASLFGDNFIGAGAGDDTIDFFGATSDDYSAGTARGFNLNGGSGNDVITGSTEDDTISGGADNDTINGGLGDDTILAGAGDDLINAENDVITGGAGADVYNWAGGASTFLIAAVANSAAATSGTARTFDSFVPYGAFFGADELNITAVTNQLAGGQYIGAALTANVVNIGALGATASFATIKTALDAGAFAASSVNQIQAYTFSANINGAGVTNYLWVQDSQSAYSSSDLLFQTAAIGSITAADIIVA